MRNHNPTFGQLIDEHQKRDAVHIAIAPVVAAERLSPGQHIGFSDPGDTEMVGSRAANHIGIVDPFLSAPVYAGERFWMLLYPQTVTGMRHEWEHPAFQAAENSEKAKSEAWLRNLAIRTDRTYEFLLEAGAEAASGETSPYGGDDTSAEILNENKADFFYHYEVVTGKRVTKEDQEGVYFRCAC